MKNVGLKKARWYIKFILKNVQEKTLYSTLMLLIFGPDGLGQFPEEKNDKNISTTIG